MFLLGGICVLNLVISGIPSIPSTVKKASTFSAEF